MKKLKTVIILFLVIFVQSCTYLEEKRIEKILEKADSRTFGGKKTYYVVDFIQYQNIFILWLRDLDYKDNYFVVTENFNRDEARQLFLTKKYKVIERKKKYKLDLIEISHDDYPLPHFFRDEEGIEELAWDNIKIIHEGKYVQKLYIDNNITGLLVKIRE